LNVAVAGVGRGEPAWYDAAIARIGAKLEREVAEDTFRSGRKPRKR